MTYRAAAVVNDAPQRPPKILGFAFYVAGAGAATTGLAALATLLPDVTKARELPSIPYLLSMVGNVMLLVGLAVAWRATQSPLRRVFALATAASIAFFAFDHYGRRGAAHVVSLTALQWLSVAPYMARAAVVALLAYAAFVAGRVFAARTWATTLAAALVAAELWEMTWPLVVPVRRALVSDGYTYSRFATLPLFVPLALVACGGGLFAAGRAILRGVTIGEYLHAKAPRLDAAGDARERDDARKRESSALRRGLPLLADATVAAMGMTFAQAVGVVVAGFSYLRCSPEQVVERSATGGHLVAGVLLVLAVRRVGGLGVYPTNGAYGALGIRVVVVVVLVIASMTASLDVALIARVLTFGPPVLVSIALFSTSTALRVFPSGGQGMPALQKNLRTTSILHAVSTAFTMASATTGARPFPVFTMGAALTGILALAFAILTTAHVRRVEVHLAA